MRSNDLAKIAGVTVKTLRHYHKVGVLPEPWRDSNNYRSYSAHHLACLLRIRRLSALGLSLDDIGDMLKGDASRADDALDALDLKLGEEVERLTFKRTLIAALRSSRSAPDIPVALAKYYDLAPFASDQVRQAIREQLVLLELAVGEEGMPLLIRYFDRLTAPDLLDATTALGERFYRLGPGSGAQDIAGLVDDYVAIYVVVRPEFTALLHRPRTNRKVAFLFEHILANLNMAQREVFLGIARRVCDL